MFLSDLCDILIQKVSKLSKKVTQKEEKLPKRCHRSQKGVKQRELKIRDTEKDIKISQMSS